MAGRGPKPKYQRLAAGVRRLIRTRGLSPGEAIPTEPELEERFACSRGTVRRGLDLLVNEGLIRRRHGAGHFVARKTPEDCQPLLGLVVPNILNAEVLRLSQRFSLEASRRGYRIVLGVMEGQPDLEIEFLKDLQRLRASGLVLFPTSPDGEQPVREHVRRLGLPYVVVNDFWIERGRDCHVAFDEVAAIEQAVAHLAGLGHERIAWLDGSDGPRRRALAGLRAALARHGLELPDRRVLLCLPYEPPPVEKLFGPDGGSPTAVITPYDGMAVRLIAAFGERGLGVPRDVSVVNLNGPPLYGGAERHLTTCVPPDDLIVERALDIVLDRDGPESVRQYLFPTTLQKGDTTGPVKR